MEVSFGIEFGHQIAGPNGGRVLKKIIFEGRGRSSINPSLDAVWQQVGIAASLQASRRAHRKSGTATITDSTYAICFCMNVYN